METQSVPSNKDGHQTSERLSGSINKRHRRLRSFYMKVKVSDHMTTEASVGFRTCRRSTQADTFAPFIPPDANFCPQRLNFAPQSRFFSLYSTHRCLCDSRASGKFTAPRGGPSHGPGDVGRVLFGLHAQHGDAGRASLKLGLGLEGVVAIGARREERVRAEEVVQGNVAELVLLVGEAHVAVVSGAGGWARGVRVRGHTGRRAARQHAGGDHGPPGRGTRPQVVGNLLGSEEIPDQQKEIKLLKIIWFPPLSKYRTSKFDLESGECSTFH